MRELVPEAYRAFLEFDQKALKDGALPGKTKELMAPGIAQITQCPWCIQAHTQKAALAGASDAEIAETTFVVMAMAAGAAWSHGGLALQCLQEHKGEQAAENGPSAWRPARNQDEKPRQAIQWPDGKAMSEPHRTALVDTSVFRLSLTANVVRVPVESGANARELIGIRGKLPIRPDHPWLQLQIEAMPTIARAARDGQLTLVDSMGLSLEEINSERPRADFHYAADRRETNRVGGGWQRDGSIPRLASAKGF